MSTFLRNISLCVWVALLWLMVMPQWSYAARSSSEPVKPKPAPVVITGTIFDLTTCNNNKECQPVTASLFLRLSKVAENGIVGELVEQTNYSTGEGVMANGSFYFELDAESFEPGEFYIESMPMVSYPQSYLGGHITFQLDWPGTHVSFFAESTFVHTNVDVSAFPEFIPSEGGELSWGFWVEGDHQDLDVRVRVGELSETGLPSFKEVYNKKLYSVCNQYIGGVVKASGKLPNGKYQCVQVYVTAPDNFEKVLAWTGYCVPKLAVSETEQAVPVSGLGKIMER